MTKEIKMTKAEALRNLKELEEYIKKLDNEAGYKEDKLFLLSTKEYERYKDLIPKCKIPWWLRSAGLNGHAAYVDSSGWVSVRGDFVHNDCVGIRPALRTRIFNHEIGEIVTYKNFPYTIIGENLAIATVPVAFDMFDFWSNDYKTSEVRKFLLELGVGK